MDPSDDVPAGGGDRILDAAPALVVVLDDTGRVLWWNSACTTLTGFSLDALRGTNILDLAPADERSAVASAWMGKRPPGSPGSWACHWVLRDGSRRWILWSGAVLTEPEGRRIVAVGMDRTEERRALDRAREAEAKFERVLSIAADGVVMIDGEQKIVAFNKSAQEMFGYTADEVLGQPLDILIPPRFRDVHRKHVVAFGEEAVESRRMGERHPDLWALRKDGEEFFVQVAISKVEVAGQRFYTAVVRDATESRLLEQTQRLLAWIGVELPRSLDYEKTLHRVAEIAVEHLADFCIIDLMENGGVRRLATAHREPRLQQVAASLQDWPLDRTRPHLAHAVLETRQAVFIPRVPEGFVEEIAQGAEHLRALKAIGPTSYMGVPLRVGDRFLGAMIFVSTRPERHFDRRDLRTAEAIAERAALAIDNARLYADRLRAIRARDEVLSIVVHDLRTPLTSVQLAASLLSEDLPPGPVGEAHRRNVAVMLRGVERAMRLIDDLLQISHIESGKLSVEPEPMPAYPLMREAHDAWKLMAEAKELSLTVRDAPRLPHVLVDHERVLQVIDNLIGNAVKFTDPGGRIELSAEAGDGEVTFRISDTGPGIPEHLRTRLFERFSQGRRGDYRGAGLGLPIARGIVEAHGGHIWFESHEERGSTFYFTLPRADRERRGAQPE